jgi:hypothetical protein
MSQDHPDKEPTMTKFRFLVARLIQRAYDRDVPAGYYWG